MAAHRNVGADSAGAVMPIRDDARGHAGAKEQESTDKRDFRIAPHSGQTLRVIEGERKAAEYIARLHAEQADPDELALIVAALYGAMLRGFCSALEKALGVRHA